MPILRKIWIVMADSMGEHHDRVVENFVCKDSVMRAKSRWHFMLVTGLLITATSTGCLQTTVGGQTLPSAYYLEDDVQYFPTGPEQKLYKQIQALEKYKADRLASQQGLNENFSN